MTKSPPVKGRTRFEAKRPKTVKCEGCKGRITIASRGRIPRFCSQRCRQLAYEKRKWQRPPTLIEALAQDVATAKVRAVIRAEVWAVLQQAGLVDGRALPPQRPERRPKPSLRVIEGSAAPDPS